jgi:DNA repair protein RAD7
LDNSGPEPDVDSVQNDTSVSAAKKRRLTKAAEAKLKAKEKKRRGIKDSDDDDMDEDDERYNAPSSRPAPGSFAHCVHCEKRFTVVG